jgi:hypothetical protein
MKVKKTMSDQSGLWGATLEYWDKRGVWLMILGGGLGFAALGATVASSFILWKVAGVAQSDLETKTRDHDKELGTQRSTADKLKKETEELRAKNLAFEKALVPRNVEQNLAAQALKEFKGLSDLVLSSNDPEARRTAGQIRWLLRQAGWSRFSGTIADPFASPEMFRTGVEVRPGMSMVAQAAAARLVAVLKDSDVDAKVGAPNGAGNSIILVQVGLKPLPPSLQVDASKMPADARGNKMWGNTEE